MALKNTKAKTANEEGAILSLLLHKNQVYNNVLPFRYNKVIQSK